MTKRFLFIWLLALGVILPGIGLAADVQTVTISSAPPAGGTWTTPVCPAAYNLTNKANISIYGSTWTATVTLQRSWDGGSTWHTVKTWTSNSEEQIEDPENAMTYRIGVDNGDWTSGSVSVRIGRP